MPEDVQTYAARVAAARPARRRRDAWERGPFVADRPRRSESERERLRRISILNARLPKKRTIAPGRAAQPRRRGAALRAQLQEGVGPARRRRRPGGVARHLRRARGRGGARHPGHRRPPARRQLAAAVAGLGRRPALPVRPRRRTTPASSTRRCSCAARSPAPTGARSRMPRRTSRPTPRACSRSPTTPSTRPTWRTASRPEALSAVPDPPRQGRPVPAPVDSRPRGSHHRNRRTPNVGKSTLFNALTKNDVLAANYPFATIEPNVGVVGAAGPAARACSPRSSVSEQILPATVSFVDIAGIVRGASEGEGLGNKFLANIREADAICQVMRVFARRRRRARRRQGQPELATSRRSTPS